MLTLKSTLAKRLFYGTLMIFVLVALFVGEGYDASHRLLLKAPHYQGFYFCTIIALFACLGARELFSMSLSKGWQGSLAITAIAICIIVTHGYWFNGNVMLLLSGLLLIASLYHGINHGTQETFGALGQSCFITIYLGVGCYFMGQIRGLGIGEATTWGQIKYVVMFTTVVKSADIGAFFVGRSFGKHKWVPSISPGKTWEGFFGGVSLAMIVTFLFACGMHIIWYKALVFGVAVGIIGPLGDLLESMLKRDAGSKDSAQLVPAFGGMMDLLDSPIIAAPVAYCLLHYWII